jgi:hypothetical protein
MPRVVSRYPAVTVGRPRFTPFSRSGAPVAVVSGDPRRTAVLEVKARRRTPAGETPAPLRRGQRPAVVDRRSLEGRASSRPQLPPTLAPLQLAAAESRTASGSRPVAGRGPTKGDGAPRSFALPESFWTRLIEPWLHRPTHSAERTDEPAARPYQRRRSAPHRGAATPGGPNPP